jgi:hypothetical protein
MKIGASGYRGIERWFSVNPNARVLRMRDHGTLSMLPKNLDSLTAS